jgi:hypothetical protein
LGDSNICDNNGPRIDFFAEQAPRLAPSLRPQTGFARKASRYPVDTGPIDCPWTPFAGPVEISRFKKNRPQFLFTGWDVSLKTEPRVPTGRKIVPAGTELFF